MLFRSLGGSDIAAIKAAQEKVARVSQEVGGALYAQAQADGAGAEGAGDGGFDTGATGAGAGAQASDDDVVDAEIVDEGPDKK